MLPGIVQTLRPPMLLQLRSFRACGQRTFAATASSDDRGAPGGSRARVQRRQPGGPRGRQAAERPLSSSAATAAQPAPVEEDIASTPCRSISVLNRYRALLLDSTYRPVGVANWQRAVCLDLMDKADVLDYYEDVTVRSVREEFYLPAVLRVRTHRSKAHHTGVSLSRTNILLRDRYSCQYCGSSHNLTIDHVVPQSKGGANSWDNLVACCSACNSKKGDKSLEQLRWKLRQTPKEPSIHEMDFLLAMLVGSTNSDLLPQEWQAYIVPYSRKKDKGPRTG